MSALVVSMSSMNPSFAREFKSQHDGEVRMPHEGPKLSPPTNAGPRCSTSSGESPQCRYSLDSSDDDEEEEDTTLAKVSSHDSTEHSYILVQKPPEPIFNGDNESDPITSTVELDVMMVMGDDVPLPVIESSSEEQEPFLWVQDDSLVPVVLTAQTEATPKMPYGGLQNLGNTCYLNSALQMLASLDGFGKKLQEYSPEHVDSPLRKELLAVLNRLNRGETVQPDSFKTQVDERSPLFIGYRQQDAHEFLTTLLDLLDEDYKKKPLDDQEMTDADSDSDNNDMQEDGDVPVKKQRLDAAQPTSPAISPALIPSLPSSGSFKDLKFDDIETLLYGDKAEPSSAATLTGSKGQGPKCKLIGGRMNTAGVHLTRWGDDGNLDASAGVKTVAEEGNASETSQDAKPHSPIDETFTTEVRVCLTCDSCKYRRSHTETYLHLSLEIGPPIGSIEEGIRAFFKPEKRDVKCEKCFCETASQTMEVTRLPRAMLFHLKRFIVDISPDYSNISYRKDQSPVTFMPVLEIDERSGILGEVVATNEIILPRNSKYTLRSVVNHIGSSASCGHYTADAVKQGEWIRCNDDYVTKIPDSYAVENVASTAYMVLYELETV